MVSRSTRVAAVGVGLAVLVGIAMGLSGLYESLPYGEVVTALIVFPGLSLLAPQLYLARTTDDPAMRRRHLRVGLGLSGALTLLTAPITDPADRAIFSVVGGGLLAALLVWEAVEGYRESSLFADADGE
ncbi:hypothetical protein [Halorientalis halophila]|uniref:hypothetical protein n=1 Tax=Halorientalis halophila TaxID=3108499 RepID=UPI0030089E2A